MISTIYKLSLTDDVVAVTVGVGVGGVVVGGVIVGGSGASAIAVDVSTGAAVAADNDDAADAVVPPSLTNDKDAYVSALVAFKGMCVGAFADGAGESAAASALLPPRCCRRAVRR